ncbi:MAG: zinc-ribbon domain-containing protein [Lachnospiraceae bacterium]|nr:zinc-ribbon domain-containing protein [Candidatus Colinaster equi]
MFCNNCGKELKTGAKFCEECGATIATNAVQSRKPKSRKIVILILIVSVVVIALAILIAMKIAGKGDTDSSEKESNTSTETLTELPELAPDSEEEYEAFLDKLEYLTLGDETGDEIVAVEDDLVEEDYSQDVTDNSENGASIASALSTTDYANAMDFEWLHDVTKSDGTGAGIILDTSHADPIPTDDNSYLNGGWKAYMFGTDSDYGERYMNAEIDASEGKINITLNWKYFCLEGTTYEEDGSSVFSGQRNPADGVITAHGSDGNLELSEFYISKDKEHEYVIGAFQYPSGELYILGLMR